MRQDNKSTPKQKKSHQETDNVAWHYDIKGMSYTGHLALL